MGHVSCVWEGGIGRVEFVRGHHDTHLVGMRCKGWGGVLGTRTVTHLSPNATLLRWGVRGRQSKEGPIPSADNPTHLQLPHLLHLLLPLPPTPLYDRPLVTTTAIQSQSTILQLLAAPSNDLFIINQVDLLILHFSPFPLPSP